MGLLTILWTLAAGMAIALAMVCGAVWLAARRDAASLMLCILGLATAGSAYFELRMMHAATPAEFGDLFRWYHVPSFLCLMAQILFVHAYLRSSRLWLLGSVVAARVVILVVNFLLHPNFNLSQVTALAHMSLLGEQITLLGAGVTRAGWQHFALAGNIALMAYFVDASVRAWRAGDRVLKRKALAVALGVSFPMACTLLYSQTMIFGVIHGPVSNIPWFLGALAMMAVELGRDFVMDRRALVRTAELQNQLAHLARVSLMGQLASALTHELSQPLSAVMMNAEIALKMMEREALDRTELSAMLGDIRRDSSRGADMIVKIRNFYKLRAIDMQPLALEEVVNDAVALVRGDANKKHVLLSLLVPPGLPRVLGDRVHLSQVLLNLLMNGIQALESRPADARRLAVEARAAGEMVEVVVRDTGDGIPADVAEKLFTPFFTTKAGGMGMGLPLSQAIIEAQGGKMWADLANMQSGAAFCFTLRQA